MSVQDADQASIKLSHTLQSNYSMPFDYMGSVQLPARLYDGYETEYIQFRAPFLNKPTISVHGPRFFGKGSTLVRPTRCARFRYAYEKENVTTTSAVFSFFIIDVT